MTRPDTRRHTLTQNAERPAPERTGPRFQLSIINPEEYEPPFELNLAAVHEMIFTYEASVRIAANFSNQFLLLEKVLDIYH